MASGPQTRASLPPKPVCQKRTRNALASFTMPPPSHASDTRRATGQRGWSRRSASWTAEEDAKLVELVKKESAVPPSITASKTWSRVAAQLTNRTGKQCRERYLNQLKPGIRRDPWSPEEERILREAHAKIGNKWVTIANQLPGRTDNCVKNHWNSMLRKRQRREAALRAAQAEVAATLGKSQGSRLEGDRRSEAEYSVHTGCATPSGVSSSYHDFPTSGIPSPYTASSPITPKRDSKLQISTLVAASTKELPNWNVPFSRQENIGMGGYISRNMSMPHTKHEMTMLGNRQMNDNFRQLAPSRQAFVQQSSAIGLPMEASSPLIGVRGLSPNDTYMAKEVVPSPMQCIASLPRVPQLMQNMRSDANVSSAVLERQVRRSSRLLSSTSKERGAVTPALKEAVPAIQKRSTGRDRGISEGVGGNALAALAAAASSVPPSPLTPESRFSTTSRSRSVSPVPRLWHVQPKTVMGSSGLDGRGKRRRTCEGSNGVAGSYGAGGRMGLGNDEGCDANGNIVGKRP